MPQSDIPLLNALSRCSRQPNAPFYAPGHKRGQGIPQPLSDLLGNAVFRADLPELPELDNLFAPEGVIQEAQELAADAFGAEQTWFLANGSTCGIEAAVLATCSPGDTIILPRNCHQSAIAALILSGAVPVFVEPEYDLDWGIAHSITPDSVAAALAQHPQAKAVMMVYPTYYGVCGDVERIGAIAHQHDVPLLVDEAHGAHFAFHPDLPIAALAAGADLVVQSTHKVLGAMTQASMLHVQGERIDRERLSRALQLVQSTSPSYLLLASLDAARWQMATQGKTLLSQTLELASAVRGTGGNTASLAHIPQLRMLQPEAANTPGFVALDPTRLTIDVTGLGVSGFEADEILHKEWSVTAELPGLQTLTFILTLGNTVADIEQLATGLKAIATQPREAKKHAYPHLPGASATTALTPREAFFAASEHVSVEGAIARISAELVCPYPPGIPVLMPGEVVTAEAIAYLQQILNAGGILTGCSDSTLQTLRVVKNAK